MVSSTEELLKNAELGDDDAFGLLLLQHFDSIEELIRPKMPVRHLARFSVEDIIQDAFSHAFRDRESLSDWSLPTFRSWLRRIAENRLLDAVEKHDAKKRGGQFRQIYSDASPDSSIRTLLEDLAISSVTASANLRESELHAAVQMAIDQLPSEQKELIVLRYMEEMSTKQLAAQTGMTESATKSKIQRIREKLRKKLIDWSVQLSKK